MRILITSYWYAPAINGVVTSVLNLERELVKKGHDVRILTISQNSFSYQRENVYYIGSLSLGKLYPHARFPIKSQNRYYDEILDWKPDVVHSQCEFFTYSISLKIAKTLDIPLIHTYHTIYEDYTFYFSPSNTLGKTAAALFSSKILAKVDKVVAPTNKVKTLLEGYDVKSEIVTIPTGIDTDKFDYQRDDDTIIQMKKKFGIKKNHKVLIAVGRLAKEKNLDEIINYISNIKDKNIKLLVVGDGPYKATLEKNIKEKKLEDKVIFTGMVAPEEIGKFYDLGDVFVCASNSETQGLTYIESLACGLPVVCKEDECVREVVYDNENGYIFNDKRTFIQSIKSIFKDKENYKRLSENARNSSKKFSQSVFADYIIGIYEETIKEKMIESMDQQLISLEKV